MSPPALPPPAPSLPTLPPDLLALITIHLPSASSLASLSLTCRTLNSFTTTHGWRTFVRTQFPLFPATSGTPADWRSWARTQITVSRGWSRRSFVARVLEPRLERWAPRGQQTIGYVPALSLAEDFGGGGEGNEVLMWGAGPDLVVRGRGRERVEWWGIGGQESAGLGDVTAVGLVSGGAEAVVGRANGRLEVVEVPVEMAEEGKVVSSRVARAYETGGQRVKDLAITTSVVSAILGNSSIGLFPLSPEMETAGSIAPLSTLPLPDGRIPWKSMFLSPSLLALGCTGQSPLSIYSISRSSLCSPPLRTFTAPDGDGVGVYALSPLNASPHVFIAGWYDGVSRLHDLRDPAHAVAKYSDPLDGANPVYAVAPVGVERFLAGGGRHCSLKVFDLRVASEGWATYLAPPVAVRGRRGGGGGSRLDREGPVYGVVVAGGGRSVIAGTQGRVWELRFDGGVGEKGVGVGMYGFGGKEGGCLYSQGDRRTEVGRGVKGGWRRM